MTPPPGAADIHPRPESDARPTPPTDPATRGLTRIAPNVVERVAAYACRGTPGVASERAGTELSKVPPVRAQADVMGSHVHLAVRLPVDYPQPIVGVAAAARQEVSETVRRLCGLHVDSVDIEAIPVNRTRRVRVR